MPPRRSQMTAAANPWRTATSLLLLPPHVSENSTKALRAPEKKISSANLTLTESKRQTNDPRTDTLRRTVEQVVEKFLGRPLSAAEIRRKSAVEAMGDEVKVALAPLCFLNPAKLQEAFMEVTTARNWSRSTQAARIATMLTLPLRLSASIIAHQQIAALKAMLRATQAIQTPAWDPQDESEYMTISDVREILQLYDAHPQHRRRLAAVLLAFFLSQRVGDVLAWRKDLVRVIRRAEAKLNTVSVVVVEGKTVSRTGPYALQCWEKSLAGQLLLELRHCSQSPYLFLEAESLLDSHAEVRTQIVHEEKLIKQIWGKKLLAPRRGSAVALGSLGVPEGDIRLMTRHPGEDMLRRYLGAGMMSNSEGLSQATTSACLESMILDTPSPAPRRVLPLHVSAVHTGICPYISKM